MRHVLAVIVPLLLVAGQVASDNKEEEEGFDFDHAFRKFQSYLEKHQEQPDRLTERMGVALGAGDEAEEEEAEIELMPEHEFLRKSGEFPDQQAVETKGLRQFASIRRKDECKEEAEIELMPE